MIHLAGQPVAFGNVYRQRCLWCGALIQEWDLRTMSRGLEKPKWWRGFVVVVEGEFSITRGEVDDPDDGRAPEHSCMREGA